MWFFFNDTATTESYTLSLHDALPTSMRPGDDPQRAVPGVGVVEEHDLGHDVGGVPPDGDVPVREVLVPRERRPLLGPLDRKSTRLNSSHANISYAVLCLNTNTILRYN